MTDLQAAIAKIRAKSREVLGANERATKTWKQKGLEIIASGRGVIARCPTPSVDGVFDCEANVELIVLSRNFSPAAAKGWLAILKHWHDPKCKCESCAALIEMAESLEER